MKDNIEFLQAFLKNPFGVGSIAPSSPELSRRMMDGIKPTADSIVLELGVGTGALTKYIQEAVPGADCYLGIELDKKLVACIRKSYPDLKFVRGDACHAHALHRRSGLGKVGHIICSLPFVSLPAEVNARIFAEIEKFMEKGCVFRTYQYAHGFYLPSAIKLREFMTSRYGDLEKSPLIVKNVPPAYTLTWRKA
jgi:phosphatidylethanolamine/phosphatidyl-N-methylethanolamine N-methyltransferase